MKIKLIAILTLSLITFLTNAQEVYNGVLYPIFPRCENLIPKERETCFYANVNDFIYDNFQVPDELKKSNYKGTIMVLFEVDRNGKFHLQFVDANENSLSDEARRVFSIMPTVKPPTYNGLPTYQKNIIKIEIPLKNSIDLATAIEVEKNLDVIHVQKKDNEELTELESLILRKFKNPQFESQLNIPFSHSYYAQFDQAMNKVGSNNHTGSKPFSFAEVNKYYDLKTENEKLMKSKTGMWAKKLWNENTIQIQGNDYWFTINPIFDLQLGKSFEGTTNTTYINTRGLQFRGELGKIVTFSTTVYENQAQFAGYFNRYAESIKPDGGNPATVPGMGIAKSFGKTAYDFPVSEASLNYTASHFMNLELGYGRNFIGDGYRSLLEADGSSPYPFFKMNTKFWRFKYTNTYMWLKDIRSEAIADKTYTTKYMANHYLSYNASNRLNLGLFESVVWANDNKRGFDMNFINPIILYRTVEFASSARSGNAILGLTAKYKFNNQINAYGQLIIDEFSIGEMKSGDNSWRNKYGYQLGLKYYNAFKVKNLTLQLEYNVVRPYVYSHLEIVTNYGHNNQSMGHQWGGNLEEFIAIGRYHKGRLFADAKLTYGLRGLDFDPATDNNNYGSNIYLSYNLNRPFDTGVVVGQGNKTSVFIADIQAGYLINPSTNMKFFGSIIYRNFNPQADTSVNFKEETTWLSLGLRCDIFNWYFDY